MVALGEDLGALYANDTGLANELLAASELSGDRLWRLPLVEAYRPMVRGTISDVKNLGTGGGGGAGSITAALFLQEFVGESASQGEGEGGGSGQAWGPGGSAAWEESRQIPWAHIDMAGPVWSTPKRQATGYGVKLLTRFILDTAAKTIH